MLGSGKPVAISPTISTPLADRSSTVERTMPTISAMSAPGTRGAMRLRSRMPTREPMPRMAVVGSTRPIVSWTTPTRRSNDRAADRREPEQGRQLADR